MKNVCFKLIFCLICVTIFNSCVTELEGEDLGVSIHYDNFLWNEYTPDTLKKAITIEANGFDQPVVLGVFNQEDGKPVGKEIEIFSNGERCTDNQILVRPGDTLLNLGFVYTTSEDSKNQWIFKVVDPGDLDCINDKVAKANQRLPEMLMKAERKHVVNPLAKIVRWTTIIFFSIVIFWLFVSRCIIWRSTKFSKVSIDYGNGTKLIKMTGCYELVCTNDPKMKDSTWKRIFVGKRQFEYNDFWTQPVIIKSGNRNKIRFENTRNQYYFEYGDIGTPTQKHPITIENINTQEKVTLQTT
jgi:hypothetical protein